MSALVVISPEDLRELIRDEVSRIFEGRPAPRARLTEQEAAAYLQIGASTLRERRKEGKVRAIKDGQLVFYMLEELDRYARDPSRRVSG